MTTPDEQSEGSDAPDQRASWMVFATMGMTVASCVAAGVILGIWLDSLLHSSPLLLFVGLLLGVGAAAASVVSQVKRFL